MDVLKVFKENTTNFSFDYIDDNVIDYAQSAVKKKLLPELSKSKNPTIELIYYALKDKKDMTPQEKNDFIRLLENSDRNNFLPNKNKIGIKELDVGDIVILTSDDKKFPDLPVMLKSNVRNQYFMASPISFDESLASETSSLIEPEDNSKNILLKDWTFAVIDEFEAVFHVGLVKKDGWLQKITNIDSSERDNHYIQKAGKRVINEHDFRAVPRAELFKIFHHYKNQKPKRSYSVFTMNNEINPGIQNTKGLSA